MMNTLQDFMNLTIYYSYVSIDLLYALLQKIGSENLKYTAKKMVVNIVGKLLTPARKRIVVCD